MGTVMIGRIHFPPLPSKIHGIWPVTEQDPQIAAFRKSRGPPDDDR